MRVLQGGGNWWLSSSVHELKNRGNPSESELRQKTVKLEQCLKLKEQLTFELSLVTKSLEEWGRPLQFLLEEEQALKQRQVTLHAQLEQASDEITGLQEMIPFPSLSR